MGSVELFEEAPTLGLNYGENISILIRDANRDKEVAASLLQMFPPPLLPEKASMRVVSGKNAVKLGEAPPAGHGPPAETRAFSGSESYAVAQGENGKWAHIHYTSPDAYEVAAIASVAGALTLVEEIDDIQPRGGILTPAYAFHGTSFFDRVQERGLGNTGHSRISWTLGDGIPKEDKIKATIRRKARRQEEGLDKIKSKEIRK